MRGRGRNFLSLSDFRGSMPDGEDARRSLLKGSEQMKRSRGKEIAGAKDDSELYGAIFRRGQEFGLRYR